eukprot:13201185-Alexandrium_andersonii.AAC.1
MESAVQVGWRLKQNLSNLQVDVSLQNAMKTRTKFLTVIGTVTEFVKTAKDWLAARSHAFRCIASCSMHLLRCKGTAWNDRSCGFGLP